MRHTIISILSFLFPTTSIFAQVGIGTTDPNASSILDITSTTAGVLVPRMTAAQKTAISLPVASLLIYQTDGAEGFWFFDGNVWQLISISSAFTTTTNVTSNAPGDYTTDDFIFGSPQLANDGNTAHNARVFFDKSKSAFRAGIVEGTEWDDVNVGLYSTAMGFDTKASALASTAMGANNIASGNVSTAMGFLTTASGIGSTAMGVSTIASGDNSTAMGESTIASGDYSTAMGNLSTASGTGSLAMAGLASGAGSLAMRGWASGAFSTTMGWNTIASGDNSIAMGYGTKSRSFGETSIGIYNTEYTPTNTTGFNAADRLFTIGNGTMFGSESNALTVFKNGDATLAGTLTANSDKRLKTNITMLSSALSNVLQLNGYSYHWMDTKQRGDKKQIGVIAQEIKALYPELVREDTDGYLSVNYSGLVPVLIEATKEQQAQIEELKQKNMELKTLLSDVKLLKANMEAMKVILKNLQK